MFSFSEYNKNIGNYNQIYNKIKTYKKKSTVQFVNFYMYTFKMIH